MRPKTRLLIATLCLVALPAASQSKDPISGTWTGYIGRSEATPSNARFEIRMAQDGSLSGKVSGANIAPGEISNGKYDTNSGALRMIVSVKAADGSGKGGTVSFDGRVSYDTASGSMVLGEEKGLFRLTKGEAVPSVAIFKTGKVSTEDAATEAARRGFTEVSGWITRAAEMVPAEKYSYRPVGTVRTFGEVVAHVADGAKYYCSRAHGKEIQWSDATEKKVTGKAAIVGALKQAFTDCNGAYVSGKQIGPLMENVAHSNLHYGNIVTYLRMMGLVPPSS